MAYFISILKEKKSFSIDEFMASTSDPKWIRSMITCRQVFNLVTTSMKKNKDGMKYFFFF